MEQELKARIAELEQQVADKDGQIAGLKIAKATMKRMIIAAIEDPEEAVVDLEEAGGDDIEKEADESDEDVKNDVETPEAPPADIGALENAMEELEVEPRVEDDHATWKTHPELFVVKCGGCSHLLPVKEALREDRISVFCKTASCRHDTPIERSPSGDWLVKYKKCFHFVSVPNKTAPPTCGFCNLGGQDCYKNMGQFVSEPQEK